MTPAAIKAFQRDHRNHLGKPLKVDGDLGQQTQWAIDSLTLCHERQVIIGAAQLDVGIVEYPPRSNSDPTGTIQRWQQRCGARPGDPYCASGLSDWISAVVPVKIPGALNLGRRFGRTLMPIAGDMVSWPTNAKGNGHCALIIGARYADVRLLELMLIEANVDDGVRCTRRLPRPEMVYSRIVANASGTCPGVIDRVPMAGGGTR